MGTVEYLRRVSFQYPDCIAMPAPLLLRFRMACMLSMVACAVSTGPAWPAQEVFAAEALEKPTIAAGQNTINDEDLLFCLLELEGVPVSRDLSTYMSTYGLFVPLGTISRLLELGITVNADGNGAGGWVAAPSHSFDLDIASRKVTIAGKANQYDPARVVTRSDDIYIETRLLGEWLSMHIDADQFNAAVNIRPFEPLPIQERMAREQRGSNTGSYGTYRDPGYPLQPFPYQLLAGPEIALALSSTLSGNDTESRSDTQYYTRISGDLLWMNGTLDLTGNVAKSGNPIVGIENGGLFLERINPEGGLLGPLDARSITVGDAVAAPLPLIGNSTIGPALIVSSYDSMQSALFDQVDLTGFLGPGWDVELYQNGQLLDYRPSGSSGTFAFMRVPLLFGLNQLKLVFHGPRGERRIETRSYNVGANMLKPGRWAYQLTLSDASRPSLFNADRYDRKGLVTWKSEVGISRWLTTSAYLASGGSGNKRNNYAGLGVTGFLDLVQIELQAAGDLASGRQAKQAGLLTRLAGASVSMRWSEYDPYWITTSAPLRYRSRWEGRLGGIRPFPFLPSSSLSLGFSQTTNDDESRSESFLLSSQNRTGGVNHTHNISLQRTYGTGLLQEDCSGISALGWTFRGFAVRAEAAYRILPEMGLSELGASYDVGLLGSYRLNNTLQYFPLTRTWGGSAALNRSEGAFSFGVSCTGTSNGEWKAGLQASINFSNEPRRGRWHTKAGATGRQGNISALAFLDANRNQAREPDEIPLKDVGFIINMRDHSARTDSGGIAFLQGLAPNVPSDVSISSSTLPDLLMVPARPGVRVLPRNGNPAKVDFPVWMTGEISGIAYHLMGEVNYPEPGIIIEAVTQEGNIAARTISQYDGYYILPMLPAGAYTVRVSGEQSGKLHRTAPLRQLTIPDQGGYFDNIDFVLKDLDAGVANAVSLEEIP